MKPDSYMPFYWREFWAAVEGWSDSAIVAYQRVLSHYWHHNHCAGIEDNDDYLRRLCRADKADWSAIRGLIFDNHKFMTQDENGRWHQKRAASEWEKSNKAYQSRRAGGINRWEGISKEQHCRIAKKGGRPKKLK